MANVRSYSTTTETPCKTTMISCTQYPAASIYCVWHNSRSSDTVEAVLIDQILNHIDETQSQAKFSPDILSTADYVCNTFSEYIPEDLKYHSDYTDDFYRILQAREVITQVVMMVLKLNLQVTDFCSITFFSEGMPNSLRDQLIRQKVKVWAQTSRTITDLSTIDVYRAPEIRLYGGDEAVRVYDDIVQYIRDGYKKLQDLGCRPEDIRLQPHNVRYGLNWGGYMRDVLHTVTQRLSWYAQITLWEPVLVETYQILRREFSAKIIDTMIGINTDVTIDNESGRVVRYGYELEAEARYFGFDKMMVCDPLWLDFKGYAQPDWMDTQLYDHQKELFIQLWNEETCLAAGWDKSNPTKIGPYDRPLKVLESEYPDAYKEFIRRNEAEES